MTRRDAGEVTEIRFRGHLDSSWEQWFGGLTIANDENGEATLTGYVVDQAALYGLLRKVRDLGLPLISVNRLKPPMLHSPGIESGSSISELEEGETT